MDCLMTIFLDQATALCATYEGLLLLDQLTSQLLDAP
jgi:hypothetical protein